MYRPLRNARLEVQLAVCSLLAAVGVGLIIWGLVGHISTLVIRGVIELVVVVVLFALLRRPTAKTP
jgi:hypothetical protein